MPCRAHGTAQQHLARAFALRRQGDHRGAVQEYSRALALNPDDFRALFNRAFTHDKLGDHAAAIAVGQQDQGMAGQGREATRRWGRQGNRQTVRFEVSDCLQEPATIKTLLHCLHRQRGGSAVVHM